MKFTKVDDHVGILTMSGNFIGEAARLQALDELDVIVRGGQKYLAVDCTELRLMNMDGAKFMGKVDTTFLAIGGQAVFYGVNTRIQGVLEASGYYLVVQTRSTEAEALDFIRTLIREADEHK